MTEQQLQELLQCDPVYQKLLLECNSLEVEYIRIKKQLTVENQKFLDKYLALCEELEYRRTYHAMHYTKA